ncbi:unnamed protein product [Moneuplotes crassus]|uniref:CRAL-TRIO domain-containing protein n=1 Tax=Euplotes crassus TaxID=5936 RepID=A0AAD1XN54_EUPCR|nr:unnamed protein product [Moneuplotes crassus]
MKFFTRKQPVEEEQKLIGHLDCLTEEQQDTLEVLKKYIQEEGITTSDRYTDQYLLRFCRAREFVLDEVKLMFKEFIEWRDLREVDDCFLLYDVSNIADVKKFYKHGFHGTDKSGRPLYLDCPCTAAPIEDLLKVADKTEMTRNYIQQFEYLLHVRLPACSEASGKLIDQVTSVVDLNGLKIAMFKKSSRELIKIPMGITQKNYPEVMHSLFFINSPMSFKAIWCVLKPFIPEKTKKKVTILRPKCQEELFEYVDEENLPIEFGGQCTCEEYDGDCFESDRGPWKEFPGDKYGEEYKKQIAAHH